MPFYAFDLTVNTTQPGRVIIKCNNTVTNGPFSNVTCVPLAEHSSTRLVARPDRAAWGVSEPWALLGNGVAVEDGGAVAALRAEMTRSRAAGSERPTPQSRPL